MKLSEMIGALQAAQKALADQQDPDPEVLLMVNCHGCESVNIVPIQPDSQIDYKEDPDTGERFLYIVEFGVIHRMKASQHPLLRLT